MLKITDNLLVAVTPFQDLRPGDLFRFEDNEGLGIYMKTHTANSSCSNLFYNAVSMNSYEIVTVMRDSKVIPVRKAELIVG